MAETFSEFLSLPHHIFWRIFLRLPSEAICALKRVRNRELYGVVSSQFFVMSYLKRYEICFLLLSPTGEIFTAKHGDQFAAQEVRYPSFSGPSRPLCFLDSFRGFVLLETVGRRFHLLNPSTGISRQLPDPIRLGERMEEISIVYSNTSERLNIFVLYKDMRDSDDGPIKTRLFSTEDDSMETLDFPYSKDTLHGGISNDKGRFWIASEKDGRDKVVVFHSDEKEFSAIELPAELNRSMAVSLGVIRDCIALLVWKPSLPTMLSLCILNDCKSEFRWIWIKESVPCQSPLHHSNLHIVGARALNELYFQESEEAIYSYRISDKAYMKLEFHGAPEQCEIIAYTETAA